MIDLNSYPIFQNNISTLKDTSLDNRNNGTVYMTESTRFAINFDGVKNEYVRGLGLNEIPQSNDALFDDGKGSLIFVEFKNGSITGYLQHDLGKKIYDSTLIFTDITSLQISDMRKNVEYFLVYNNSANDNTTNPDLISKKSSVQSSASFNSIASTFSKYGKDEYVCFGLKKFQNYCYKKVHTYTEEEFDNYLSGL